MTPTLAEYRAMQARAMTEAQLLAQVRRIAHSYGWITYHTHRSDRSEVGWPDLVLARGPHVLFRELKKETGVVSDAQQVWLDALKLAGLDVGVWRPTDLFSGTIEAALRPPRSCLFPAP